MTDSAGPPPFLVDRPFAFTVSDRQTGTILFLGTVHGPASDGIRTESNGRYRSACVRRSSHPHTASSMSSSGSPVSNVARWAMAVAAAKASA
jgi:hypothetical protein